MTFIHGTRLKRKNFWEFSPGPNKSAGLIAREGQMIFANGWVSVTAGAPVRIVLPYPAYRAAGAPFFGCFFGILAAPVLEPGSSIAEGKLQNGIVYLPTAPGNLSFFITYVAEFESRL